MASRLIYSYYYSCVITTFITMISELLPPFSASLPPPSPLACRASTGLVAPTTRFTSPGSGDKPESSQVVFCPTGPKQEVADNVRREEVIKASLSETSPFEGEEEKALPRPCVVARGRQRQHFLVNG
jgi:hypothetical protein